MSSRKRKILSSENKENISPYESGSHSKSPKTPIPLNSRCINVQASPLTISVQRTTNTKENLTNTSTSNAKQRPNSRPPKYRIDLDAIPCNLPSTSPLNNCNPGSEHIRIMSDNNIARTVTVIETRNGRPPIYTSNRIENQLSKQSDIKPNQQQSFCQTHVASSSQPIVVPKVTLPTKNIIVTGSQQSKTSITVNRENAKSETKNIKKDMCKSGKPRCRRSKYTSSENASNAVIGEPNNFNTSNSNEDSAAQRFSGKHPEYKDIGDPVFTCNECHARLWKSEAQHGNPYLRKKVYSLCCLNGKVELPSLKQPPQLLLNLLRGDSKTSKNFIENVRHYNMMFSFTSIGGKLDYKVNSGNAPFVYRMHGQNYHLCGSLLPQHGQDPRFCQLYIYDTHNEVDHRINAYGNSSKSKTKTVNSEIDVSTVFQLKGLLDFTNPLVQQFRQARDRFDMNASEPIRLKLIGSRDKDGRTHNLPTANEVAALIIGDIDGTSDKRDIIVETCSKRLQRISELHPSYLALQYPLLFPYAEDGYRPDIYHKGVEIEDARGHARLTIREFFAYRLQFRESETSLLLISRTLLQQFLVDAYTMVENTRLNYLRNNQKALRCEQVSSLYDAQEIGEYNVSVLGTRITLPSSYTGGPRYMKQNYLDAMAIVRAYGYPTLFIMFTCNPNWPEILRYLEPLGLKPEDRPDISTRVFKIKLDSLITQIRDGKLFGQLIGELYVIEFQKRGLPHAHICLFLDKTDRVPNVNDIDDVICAEIPNKDDEPELYQLVSDFMMHGPCGSEHPNMPCMKLKKCSKHFLKDFTNETHFDPEGFPLYRRRDDGNFIMKSGTRLDNRHVVGYNKTLLKQYQAHINVEWCNQLGSIKYLFKYINKGPDQIYVGFVGKKSKNDNNSRQKSNDEIAEYYSCRYISSCEAAWRLFEYEIIHRTPAVYRLSFHLPDQQPIIFDAESVMELVLSKPSVGASQFIKWMTRNRIDPDAR
ncbi:uncharacterized protein [Rutidosis leptorrhynchoides]|uniref:uncharacterized protein n=1 Tax=Rutidosis leptorrhynchoides TaxID=125765 RepID=UPI003A98E032